MNFTSFLKFKTVKKEFNNYYLALLTWVLSIAIFVLLILFGATLSWYQLNKLIDSMSFDLNTGDTKAADNKKLENIRKLLKVLQEQDKNVYPIHESVIPVSVPSKTGTSSKAKTKEEKNSIDMTSKVQPQL